MTIEPPPVSSLAVRLTTTLLCDYAQVRNGLLHVIAGGVNRLVRREFPAPMGVCFAMVMELDQFEARRTHELTIRIVDADGAEVAQGTGAMRPRQPGAPGPLRSHVPHVFDLRNVRIPTAGLYELKVYMDGAHQADVPFEAVMAPRPEPDGEASSDETPGDETSGG